MIMNSARLTSLVVALVVAGSRAASWPQSPVAQSPSTAQLVVHVTGLGSSKAPVRIAVYNSEKTWLQLPSARYITILDIESGQVDWTIEDVAAGEYAVAAFQDRNGDGELDRNFLGMPKEPYGFSNDARGIFGPASWTDAKVRVIAPMTETTIELQ